MRHFQFLLLSALLCCLVGCGDLFTGKIYKKAFPGPGCTPEPSSLSKIFTKDIKEELGCLEKTLEFFAQIVTSEKPGTLSYDELEKYINKNYDDLDPVVFESLKGLFDLNSLLTGDHARFIQKENISPLVGLMSFINNAMVKYNVYEYFSGKTATTYSDHLSRKLDVFRAFSKFEEHLRSFIKNNDNQINLDTLLTRFETEDNGEIIQKSRNLLFLKRLVLGGQKNILTSNELQRLVFMLADASKIAFDLIHLSDIQEKVKEKGEVLESLKEDLETVYANISASVRDDELVFTIAELENAMGSLLPKTNIPKYRDLILNVKGILLGKFSKSTREKWNPSQEEVFTGRDIRLILDNLILQNLRKGVYFYKFFEANKTVLTRPSKRIYGGLFYNMGANLEVRRYFDDFKRIARDYRFFMDENLIASYKQNVERTPWGMFLIATLEDISLRFYKAYGERKTFVVEGANRRKREITKEVITQEQILNVLEDFKSFLHENHLIYPKREASAAETITLMSALFQNQSNGDSYIDQQEMVEFLTTMVSGYAMSLKVNDALKNSLCQADEHGKYAPTCVRSNFKEYFKLEANEEHIFSDYFPGLAEYVDSLKYDDEYFGKESLEGFIKTVEIFARTCTVANDKKTPIPFSEGDLFVMLTGLINMESTFIRFNVGDGKGNGPNKLLDPDELKKAFKEVYKDAISNQAGKFFDWIRRTDDVFHFLLNNGKAPTYEVFSLVPFGARKKEAKRSSVAGVLKVISENSEANANSGFNCDDLLNGKL